MKDLSASASGIAIGSAGFAYAEFLPHALQIGNLILVAVSVTVGVLTIVEKVRNIRTDRYNSRIQRKLLRRLGGDPDDTKEADF